MCRALLSASLQLARIQTDSVVEMLRELYPDLRFEIGKFFFLDAPLGCTAAGASRLSLCARGVCRALSLGGGFDPAYLRVPSEFS